MVEPAQPLARRLRALFARSDDPYAGADLALAHRLVALMWTLGGLLAVAFVPFAPPTAALGQAGWLVFCPVVACSFAIARFIRRGGPHATYPIMLVCSYVGLAQLAVVQWLSGGHGSPVGQLYLLAVIAGVAVHPPRRAAPLLGALALAAASPLAYDGWTGVSDIAARVMLWFVMAFVVMVLIHNVRRQRVAMRKAELRAEADARIDPLTGIGNRRAFDEALPTEIASARRAGAPLAVVVLDVDSFKAINDAAGHAEGDRTLVAVAQALQEGLRASDRPFRWGGDEFSVLLPATDRDGALGLRARVEGRLARVPCEHRVELSWGAADLVPGDDAASLIARADLDLMAEKAAKQADRSADALSGSATG
jgi:diguanylate cyclase (GGDEF)-like protein